MRRRRPSLSITQSPRSRATELGARLTESPSGAFCVPSCLSPLLAAIFVMTLAPAIASLALELGVWAKRELVSGDLAVTEIHVKDLLRGQHLLGPYSRFGWNHPGPLYHLALAPLYLLTGERSGSLYLSAALIALGSVAAMMALSWRLERGALQRAVVAALIGAFVAHLASLRPSSFPWNPYVCALPFGVFWLLCTALAAGRAAALPFVLVLHAFLVQTHISYALCCTGAVAVALGLYARCWWRARPDSDATAARSIAWAGLALAGSWIWPIIAELRPGASNISAILHSYDKVTLTPAADAVAIAARQLHLPVLRALPIAPDGDAATAIGAALCAVQFVLLTLAVRRSFVTDRRVALAGGLLGLVGLALAFLSCRHIGKVHHAYLTLWFGFLGLLNWMPVGSAWLAPSLSRAPRWSLFVAAVPIGLGLLGSASTFRHYEEYRQRRPPAGDVHAAAQHMATLMAAAEPGRLPVLSRGRGAPNIEGLILQLRKRGLAPVLDERLRYKFGGGFDYRESPAGEHPWMIVTKRLSHDHPVMATFGDVIIQRHRDTLALPHGSSRGVNMSSFEMSVVTAKHFEGSLPDLTDGYAPEAGSRWNSAGTVRLSSPESSLLLELPASPAGTYVEGLQVTADANDTYAVDGSYDGVRFTRIGRLDTVRGPGLRSRHFHFNDLRAWRFVKLSVVKSDERASIAEVSALVASGHLLDRDALRSRAVEPNPVRASAAVAHEKEVDETLNVWLRTGLVGARVHELMVMSAKQRLTPPTNLAIAANGVALGTASVGRDRRIHHFVIPVGTLDAVGDARIEITPSGPGETKGMRFRSFLIRPCCEASPR